MKKVFATLFVACAFALVSCGGKSESTSTVDTTASAAVDSVVTPVVDTTMKADSTMKVDSTMEKAK